MPQSVFLPPSPPQSGLSLKLSFNHHAVSSDSLSSFAASLLGLSPRTPFVPLLQSRAQHEALRRSHTGTTAKRKERKTQTEGETLWIKSWHTQSNRRDRYTRATARVGLTAGLLWCGWEMCTKTISSTSTHAHSRGRAPVCVSVWIAGGWLAGWHGPL